MQLHNLKRKTKNKKKITVGRGGTRGKTSGRGTKGQNARAGHKKRPELRDIIKKLPKQRGRGKNSFKSFAVKPTIINLGTLESVIKGGEVINQAFLLEKGLIKTKSGVVPKVKILGNGTWTKKATFTGLLISASGKSKIEANGGKID